MASALNNNSNDNKRLEIILEVITIRVKVRSVVDTDKQVNLKELKPAELNRNTSLAQHDTKCTEIVLSVNAKYKDSLGRIMKHKDFISFNLELIEESSDMRKAFSNMPILIKISKKVVGGDD